MNKPYTIYFAGELFDHKHLVGNVLLAKQIESAYPATYTCFLPQDYEKNFTEQVTIRNTDLQGLMRADLALFNFDGTELDSGTVVEFMVAKMLDIPAVVVRTDMRLGGTSPNLPWNLMAHGFPRTELLPYDAYAAYWDYGIEGMHRMIADEIHKAFERVLHMPSIFNSEVEVLHAYRTATRVCGSDMHKYISDDHACDIVQTKCAKGLYQMAQAGVPYDQASVSQTPL